VANLQPTIHTVQPSIRFESSFQDLPTASTTESTKLQENEDVTKTVSTTVTTTNISAATTIANIGVDDNENSAKDQVIEKPIEIDEAVKTPVIQVVAVIEEQILDDFDESGVEKKLLELSESVDETIQNSNLTTGFQTSNSNSKTTSNLKQKHTSKLKP
jgi:hypothetical protein